jgi:glycosyltransferase involved in cell wall biosynthesis
MNKLSVVTITYNQEKFIGQALESIVNQKTNFEFEVLVGDDCSTDRTKEIIIEYANRFPKIIKPYFNKKNVGSLKNYLGTLSKVDSQYVAFCDGDDYWCDDNKLQEQVDFLDSHAEYSICFHQTRVFFENKEEPDSIFPRGHFAKTTSFEDLVKENYIPANTVMYRWKFNKDNSIENVFPQGIYPGDYYTHLLHAKDGKIFFINKVMSCYRRHSGGVWWLSAQKDGRDAFTQKYGIPYLNFFKAVEKEFNLDESVFRIRNL